MLELSIAHLRNVFMKTSESHIKKTVIHIIAMASTAVSIVAIFFFLYLPYVTKPNALVVVPNVWGKSFEEAVSILKNNHLRYEVSDSNYYADWPPKTVLLQYPGEKDTVKKNRKIYLTLNRIAPPSVRIPDIIDGSLKSARLLLNSHHLVLGDITYVHDLALNAVLGIQMAGKKITKEMMNEGYHVPINTRIDLLVGDGYGTAMIDIPDLIGRPIDEAESILKDIGLEVGEIHYVKRDTSVGTVINQNPASDSEQLLYIGNKINLWVTGDSTLYDR